MSQSQRIAKNVAIMMGTQFITWGFSFLTMIFLPRYFGVIALGQLATAGTTLALCGIVGGLNASIVLTKDIARDPTKLGDYIIAMLPMRVALAIVTVALAVCAVNLIPGYDARTRLFLYIMAVSQLWGPIGDGLNGFLRGQQNFARLSLISLVEKISNAALTLGLIWLRAPLWVIVASGLLTSLVSFFLTLAAFKGVVLPRPALRHLTTARYLLLAGLPYFSMGVFNLIYGQVNVPIIRWLDGYVAVGCYGLVKRLFGTALFIPTTVVAALLPQLARMYHDNSDAFARTVRRMNNLIMICAAPIAATLIFAPSHLVKLMESRHHEGDFQNAIPLFVLFGFALILWFLSQSLSAVLIASDRQAIFGKTTALACALIVPVCVPLTWLTKRFYDNGAIGASLTDILIEIVLLVWYIRALPPGIFTRENVAHLGRIGLASVPMGAIMLLLSGKIGLFSLAPGILAYAACGYALKIINPDEIQILRQILRRRTGAQETAAALQTAADIEAGSATAADGIRPARRRKVFCLISAEGQSLSLKHKRRRPQDGALGQTDAEAADGETGRGSRPRQNAAKSRTFAKAGRAPVEEAANRLKVLRQTTPGKIR